MSSSPFFGNWGCVGRKKKLLVWVKFVWDWMSGFRIVHLWAFKATWRKMVGKRWQWCRKSCERKRLCRPTDHRLCSSARHFTAALEARWNLLLVFCFQVCNGGLLTKYLRAGRLFCKLPVCKVYRKQWLMDFFPTIQSSVATFSAAWRKWPYPQRIYELGNHGISIRLFYMMREFH